MVILGMIDCPIVMRIPKKTAEQFMFPPWLFLQTGENFEL